MTAPAGQSAGRETGVGGDDPSQSQPLPALAVATHARTWSVPGRGNNRTVGSDAGSARAALSANGSIDPETRRPPAVVGTRRSRWRRRPPAPRSIQADAMAGPSITSLPPGVGRGVGPGSTAGNGWAGSGPPGMIRTIDAAATREACGSS